MPFFLRQIQQQQPPELPTNDPTYVAIIVALMLLQLVIAIGGVSIMVIAALKEIAPPLMRRLSFVLATLLSKS